MTLKLSVVKTSGGNYLVNGYYKSPDIRVPDFPEVISQMCKYASKFPEIFEQEPVLRDLSKSEETAIENFRNLVLEKRVPTG